MDLGDITKILLAKKDTIGAAIALILAGGLMNHWLSTRLSRYRIQVEFEYAQKKRLHELIGKYHGRILNAANSVNYRLWNLYKNQKKEWLFVNGNYEPSKYYFHSTVYRFIYLWALLRQFEREAIFVDARYAEKRDFIFIKYTSLLGWCMTDVALFAGLQYNSFDQTDHFFSDNLRYYCDLCVKNSEGELIEFNEYINYVQYNRILDPILKYFDSISPAENRFRWDRLVAFHLLVAAFINNIGYKQQQTKSYQFIEIALKISNYRVLENLIEWLPRHGLKYENAAAQVAAACLMSVE